MVDGEATGISHFETNFQFQFTHFCRFGGADGLAFVMQSAGPDAIGGRGSAGGFGVASRMYRDHSGIPWSFAIFFDTWKNSDEGDSSDNHIAIRSNGRSSAMRWPADRLAFTPTLPVHLKDGRVHTARIVYERPVIQVYIDTFDSAVLATTLDLAPVADSEGKAWIGFTASTGWGCENHDVLRWSFQSEKVSSDTTVVSSEVGYPMSACLPEHNLCTPEKSFIKRVGDTYHLVLPGNAIWGVRIPNPMNARPVIMNAHGVVCWDLGHLGLSGCTGPSGKGGPAGAGFLFVTAPAGALVARTENGATSFSVNGRMDSDFKQNEGFYEFDVKIEQ
jgi:hypothetical protein